MSFTGGFEGNRSGNDMSAFWEHVYRSDLSPHPQYRKEADQIQTADIANDAITAAKIAADAVGSSEIAANAVGSSEIADGAVTQAKLGSLMRAFYICTTATIPGSLTEGDMYYLTDENRMMQVSGAWAEHIAGRPPYVFLTRSLAYSLASATPTAINFPTGSHTEVADTDNMHSGSTNTTRLTVPSQRGGIWRVQYQGAFASNTTGTRSMWIQVNGSGMYAAQECASAGSVVQSGSVDLVLAPGDYVEVVQYQSSGGALYGFGTLGTDYFGMTYVGWGP